MRNKSQEPKSHFRSRFLLLFDGSSQQEPLSSIMYNDVCFVFLTYTVSCNTGMDKFIDAQGTSTRQYTVKRKSHPSRNPRMTAFPVIIKGEKMERSIFRRSAIGNESKII